MKTLWVLAFVAAAGVVVGAATRDDSCDLKKIEKGYACNKCEKELQRADIKRGKCAACGERAVSAAFCVKKGFSCHKSGCSKGPFTKPGG